MVGFLINSYAFGPPPRTFTFINYARANKGGTTSNPIPMPAEAQVGDLGVFMDNAGGTGTPTTVTPTGWTNIMTTGTNPKAICSYKVLASGDLGGNVTGMTGTSFGGCDALLLVFRPNFSIATVTAGSASGQITDSNPSPQTITASGQTPPLISFAHFDASSAIDPRTSSVTMDEVAAATDKYAKYKIYSDAESPENIDVDMDDEGIGNVLQSFYLRFT